MLDPRLMDCDTDDPEFCQFHLCGASKWDRCDMPSCPHCYPLEEDDMTERNAKIRSTTLGYEDHGILTCWLNLDYGNSGQSFGGYALDSPDKDKTDHSRKSDARAMDFLAAILKTVGVDTWEKLPGQYIRVRADHYQVESIGNLLEDKWLTPREFWK